MKTIDRIFIGGLPRSGTTMVQNILDTHPSIYGGPEFDRIPNIIDLRNKLLDSLNAGRIALYTNKQTIDKSIAGLINSLFSTIKTEKEFDFISEKTPWNILFFEELLEVFPKAKFVMVMRNPLDVYNSMKNVATTARKKNVVPPDFTTNYKLAVAYMEAVYKIMEKLLDEHPDRVYMVRYEELLNDLEVETRTLCKHIGVEWVPELLKFNEVPHPGEATMTSNEIWYTKASFKADPKERRAKTMASSLSYSEKTFITYMFRKNTFVNRDGHYLKEPTIFQKILGRIMLTDYKANYQFKIPPKRVLG